MLFPFFILVNGLEKNPPVDLIISTVPFECEGQVVVVVNPFLLPQDIQLIEGHLKQLKKFREGRAGNCAYKHRN
ncbi:hypothetical protein GCM10020331_088540 [Ectobacillus funiculus]